MMSVSPRKQTLATEHHAQLCQTIFLLNSNHKFKAYHVSRLLKVLLVIPKTSYKCILFDIWCLLIKQKIPSLSKVMGTKANPPPTDDMTLNGSKFDSSLHANSFNSFFTNIGPELASKINSRNAHFTDYLPQPNPHSLFLSPTNPTEIINITRSLNNSKSHGHDRISVSFLKEIIHPLANPLSHIFNKSLSQGVFPDLFKIAKINPIFKKDNPHEIRNYRPISLLPSISKIFEKIVYNRLYEFINKHNLLTSNQYGFRKK